MMRSEISISQEIMIILAAAVLTVIAAVHLSALICNQLLMM